MPDLTPQDIRDRLAEAARDLGFDAVGVAAVGPADGMRAQLFEWLNRGYHATMEWMARDPERRADVERVLPGARSVISLAINYYSPREADDSCGSLKVSRYAWGKDYHLVIGEKLKVLKSVLEALAPGEQSVAYVDTGPIMEKAWAQRAGIGWIGLNGNLIIRDLGSWVFLAEIITTLELPPDEPHSDFCGTCTRCIDACPTEAIVEPYVVDSNKCISYWTIEHRGDFPEGLTENYDGWIFGCDICQDVCPWNRFEKPTREADFEPRCDCVCPPGDKWEKLSESEFRQEFADSAIRRTKRDGLVRNIRAQNHIPLRDALQSVRREPLADDFDITVEDLVSLVPGVDPKTP